MRKLIADGFSPDMRLRLALAIMRLSIGAFFLVWSLEKILAPEVTQRVFATFYFIGTLPIPAAVAIGIVQTVVVLAFTAGAFKTWTYGALLAMHAFSVLSTWERLGNPYEPPNHLFWAGVPVLGALVALFLLRKADTWLSVAGGRTRSVQRPSQSSRGE